MKNILKNISLFIVAFAVLNSCEDSDDNTGESLIDYSSVAITVVASDNDVIIMEAGLSDDAVYTVTASITESVPVELVIDLVQTGGNAGSDDFELSTITIPAGALTGSGSITIFSSGDVEGDETLSVGAVSRANGNVAAFTFNANITDDYINDVLDLTLAWDGTASSGDVTIDSFCDIDFDLILYDSAFNSMGYIAGTSACPETGGLGGLPDGTYYLVTDLWSNPFSGLGFTDTIPVSISWSQDYFPDTAGTITSDAYTLADTSGLGGLIVVLEVANGYEFTLSPF